MLNLIRRYCTAGMEGEIKRARWKNYRIRYFTEDCKEVTDVRN